MKYIHMMIGIPGSGKTTFAKRLSLEKNYQIVSTDVVRQKNLGIEETNVWPLVYQMVGNILQKEDNVIFDATNISKKVRERFVENVNNTMNNLEYRLIGYFFPTASSECVKRVEIRNQQDGELFIPLDVIESYGNNVYPPTYEENFEQSFVISQAPKLLQGLVDNAYQGYALYFRRGNKAIEEYSGFADIDTFEAVRHNTNFRLASVSKQFMAYGIMTLVSKNMLSLDESLYNLFSDMPEYTKNIKVRNMLNHTSGIFDYEDMEHTEKQVNDYDVLDYIKTTKETYFEIGSKYQYSNTAYVLLGLIIEKVSGEKLGVYLDKEIFSKLGMVNSLCDYEGVSLINNRAYGNIVKSNKLVKKDQYWCSATIGDGGVYSSIDELKKWLEFIKNIKEEPFIQMKTTNIINGKDIEYGLGLRIKEIKGHKIIYHCGDTIGTNTIIGYMPTLDIDFIFLTNCQGKDTSRFVENLKSII